MNLQIGKKFTIKTILSLALAFVILYIFVSTADIKILSGILSRAHVGLILLALASFSKAYDGNFFFLT